MKPIARSGLHYPNKIARIFYQTIEEIMGKNGLGAVLKLAHVAGPAGAYPPDNLAPEYDFSDYSALNGALEEMYGARGGRALAVRAARASFNRCLRSVGPLAGAGEPAFKSLPLGARLKIGLAAMAKSLSQASDQKTWVEDCGDEYHVYTAPCPVCWGRQGEAPLCHATAALLEEGLRWVTDGREFSVREDKCLGCSAQACVFVIQKEPIR